jgi:hypothetical protein
MIPIAAAVAFLVAVAWLFSWVRPDTPYEPTIHPPEVRPPRLDRQAVQAGPPLLR